MLYYLSQKLLDWSAGTHWADHLSALRLFRYITVRSAGAAITALILSWWLGPKIIHWLKQLKFGQDYADKAETAGGLGARVLSKKGTPTMGGILIIAVLVFSTMLWAQWNAQIEVTLLSVLVLSGLGFYDDYAKIIQQSGGGTPPLVACQHGEPGTEQVERRHTIPHPDVWNAGAGLGAQLPHELHRVGVYHGPAADNGRRTVPITDEQVEH